MCSYVFYGPTVVSCTVMIVVFSPISNIQVRDGRTTCCKEWRTEESCQEAEHHQHAVVGRQHGWDLK